MDPQYFLRMGICGMLGQAADHQWLACASWVVTAHTSLMLSQTPAFDLRVVPCRAPPQRVSRAPVPGGILMAADGAECPGLEWWQGSPAPAVALWQDACLGGALQEDTYPATSVVLPHLYIQKHTYTSDISLCACGSVCGLDILEIHPWLVSLVQWCSVWPRYVLVSACKIYYV